MGDRDRGRRRRRRRARAGRGGRPLDPRRDHAALVHSDRARHGVTWVDAKTQAGTKGANISLSYALAGLCPLGWNPGRARLRACADVELGAIRADGFDFPPLARNGESFVAQGELEGRLGVRLAGPLTAELGLGFIVPFNRADFFYLDASEKRQDLYKVAAVAGIVDAALGVAFP